MANDTHECVDETESVIEDMFEAAMLPRLHASVKWRRQVPSVTPGATYRLDFVAEVWGPVCARCVGLECDGRDFHNWREDMSRDIAILKTRAIQAIVRFPGANIYHDADRCTAWLRWYEPEIFTGEAWAPQPPIPDAFYRNTPMALSYRFFHEGKVWHQKNPYLTYERKESHA